MPLFKKLLLIPCFIPFLLSAQSNFRPGIAVKLDGDTVRGFIDYREWEKNPASISFRYDTLKSKRIKFTVSDIKYFNVSVGHLAEFVKYTGEISTNDININNLVSAGTPVRWLIRFS